MQPRLDTGGMAVTVWSEKAGCGRAVKVGFGPLRHVSVWRSRRAALGKGSEWLGGVSRSTQGVLWFGVAVPGLAVGVGLGKVCRGLAVMACHFAAGLVASRQGWDRQPSTIKAAGGLRLART